MTEPTFTIYMHMMNFPETSWESLHVDKPQNEIIPVMENKYHRHRSIPIRGSSLVLTNLPNSPNSHQYWISIYDIMKICGKVYNKSSLEKISQHWSTEQKYPMQLMPISTQWNVSSQVWCKLDSSKISSEELEHKWMIHENDLCTFVKSVGLRKTRKTRDQQLTIYHALGIEFTPEEEKQAVQVCIETQLVDALQRIWPTSIETQFRLPGYDYRFDILLDKRLIIEIDEHGHQSYDIQEEKKRMDLLREHNYQYIRFNPHQKFKQSVQDEFLKVILDRWIQIHRQTMSNS